MANFVKKDKIKYSDLDQTFFMHPVTRDVNVKYNREAVIQAVKNLVMLKKYEAPFHPEVHSGVSGLLFENANILTAQAIRENIRTCLQNYEPRIRLHDVRVYDRIDNNEYEVDIKFEVINIPETITLSLALQRVR